MFSSVRSSYTEVRSGCDHWCNWKAYWINVRTNPMSLNIDNWHFSAQVSIYIHMYNRNFLPISENIYRKMHSLSLISYQAFHFFTANEVQYILLKTFAEINGMLTLHSDFVFNYIRWARVFLEIVFYFQLLKKIEIINCIMPQVCGFGWKLSYASLFSYFWLMQYIY